MQVARKHGPDVLTGDQSAKVTTTSSGGLLATATSMVVGYENVTSTASLFQFATATAQPLVGSTSEARGSQCLSWTSLIVGFVYLLA